MYKVQTEVRNWNKSEGRGYIQQTMVTGFKNFIGLGCKLWGTNRGRAINKPTRFDCYQASEISRNKSKISSESALICIFIYKSHVSTPLKINSV